MRSTRNAIAAGLVTAVWITLGIATPGHAEPPVDEAAREARRPKTEELASTPVVDVPMEPPLKVGTPATPPSPVAWPAPGAADVTLPAQLRSASAKSLVARGTSVAAGSLPVRVGAPSATGVKALKAAGTPAGVRVRVLGHDEAERLGIHGLLLSVTRTDAATSTGSVGLEVDYSAFAHAFGGDWAGRLTVSRLPDCALTHAAACPAGTPLATRNDLEKQRLTVDVPAPASVARAGLSAAAIGGLLALDAGNSGSTGSYSATSLAPSGTWQSTGNTGGFSWSYPLRVPPALAGPAPQLALAYSSSSVDGRTGSTNSQPSWVGEGFELNPGFIERSYKSCKDDGHDDLTSTKYDLCWAGEKLSISFGGHSGELVSKSTNEWRLKNDDGTVVKRSTDGANEDNNDETFTVTTPDGAAYTFGSNTDSAWAVPVYGDDTDEPCHGDTFTESRCKQAWRWNLDKVVDVRGNSMTYDWVVETNRYGANRNDTSVEYDRGGYLQSIEYGTRDGETAKAPAKVTFGVKERCKGEEADCEEKDLTKDTATRWPDVPFDQICIDDKSCKENWAPSFFSRKRLDTVTTSVLSGSSYRDVDVWQLEQSYPDPADASTGSLWLDAIAHTGKGFGSSIDLPKTTFQSIGLENRVDRDGDDRLPYVKYRIRAIQSETGGIISVNYADTQCTPGNLPDPATNTKRCFPSFWSAQGTAGEKDDWFHSYVVDSVVEDDRTASGVDKVTHFEYDKGGVAWHYDDDELAKAKKKTWSQFRGYNSVRTVVGGDDNLPKIITETTYLRGMDGDRSDADDASKKRDVDRAASDGTTVRDDDHLQGFALEQRAFNGADEVNGTVSTPWLSGATATEGSDVARRVGTATVKSRTALDGGKVRTTSATNHFDDSGMVDWSSDSGDTGVTGDETCTRTWYARNTAKNLLTPVSRVQKVAKLCADDPVMPDDHISDVRTSYDDGDWGDAAKQGNITRTEKLTSFSTGKPVYTESTTATYDKYGRLRFSYDAKKYETETSYTPADGGPVTGVTVKDPLGHKVVTTVDPAWGLVTAATDANNQTTNVAYDALGRRIKVWTPGRDPKTAIPDLEYGYTIRTDAPVAVSTTKLTPNEGRITSYELFDGLLRSRQTQTPSPKTGRIVTTAEYDSRGLSVATVGPFHNGGEPGKTLVDSSASTEGVPTRTTTDYDAAGRPLKQTFSVAGEDKWSTLTTYHGDRIDVDPPTGATPTTTWKDASGLTTRLAEYKGDKPTGDADVTTYKYDQADRLKEVKNQAGDVWAYGYDLLGRRTSTLDPDTGSSSVTYTKLDEVETTADARKRTLVHTYDKLSRPTLLELAPATAGGTNTKLASWTYDTATLGVGRVATATRWVGTDAYVTATSEYDPAGRAKSSSVTVPPVEGRLAGTYTNTATYRLDGSPDSTTLPATADLPEETIRNGYDAYGLPVYLTGASGYARNTTYTRLGEIEQVTLGTSSSAKQTWLTAMYEAGTRRLQVAQVDREIVTGNDANVRYDYDAAGNTLKMADTPTTAGAKVDVQCLQYDYLRRVTEAWSQPKDGCAATPAQSVLGGPAPYWQSFTYTTAGDRKTEVNHAVTATGTQVAKTYQPYGLNRLPAHAVEKTDVVSTTGANSVTTADTYGYDESGNMTRRKIGTNAQEEYRWDAEGHQSEALKGGTTIERFVYDASGQRLIRRDLAGKSATLYLGGTEIRVDTTNPDLTKQKVTATRYYAHAGLTVAMRTAAGVTWLTGGQNGTAELAITAADSKVSQRRTLPFGQLRAAPTTWLGEKGFVGGTIDSATGLTHIGAREYDPATGRFLSADPLIDFNDPQQLNGYAYGRNNPLSFPDPTGLMIDGGGSGFGSNLFQYGKGFWDGGSDAVHGLWQLGADVFVNTSPWASHTQRTQAKARAHARGQIWRDLFTNPGAAWATVSKPYRDDIDAGNDAHAAGRATFDLLTLLMGGEGLLGKGAAATGAIEKTAGKAAVVNGAETAASKVKQLPGEAKKIAGDTQDGGTPSRAGASCSFVAATPVLMADGSAKPIADLKVGDQILATDPVTNVTAAKPVTVLYGNLDTDLADLTVTDGDGERAVIRTTQNHPFWDATTKRWTRVDGLRRGDELRSIDGAKLHVVSVRSYGRPRHMYNLTVEDIHTYYVLAGNTPVLVHNDGGIYSWPNVDGPIPQRGQTALYAQWDKRTGEFLKWGVWTNTTGKYSRYTQKYLLGKEIQTTVIRNYDTKAEAHAVERDLVSRAPGPHNVEQYAGSKSTGESPLDILRGIKGGEFC